MLVFGFYLSSLSIQTCHQKGASHQGSAITVKPVRNALTISQAQFLLVIISPLQFGCFTLWDFLLLWVCPFLVSLFLLVWALLYPALAWEEFAPSVTAMRSVVISVMSSCLLFLYALSELHILTTAQLLPSKLSVFWRRYWIYSLW